jgi:thiamine kinase-like enzyme
MPIPFHDPRMSWCHESTFPSTKEFFRKAWLGLDPVRNRDTIRPRIEPFIERPCRVVFCHGDLKPRNMIFPGGLDAWRQGRTRVCLIDWEYAGWMPEPWDAIKAAMEECEADSEWLQVVRQIFPEQGPYLDAEWLWRSESRMMLI